MTYGIPPDANQPRPRNVSAAAIDASPNQRHFLTLTVLGPSQRRRKQPGQKQPRAVTMVPVLLRFLYSARADTLGDRTNGAGSHRWLAYPRGDEPPVVCRMLSCPQSEPADLVAVGIRAPRDAASVRTSAAHPCLRMRSRDVSESDRCAA